MTGIFAKYIFHWNHEKAIYLGGHSLLWDARCAGLYVGIGITFIFLFLLKKKHSTLPSPGILATICAMFVPMAIDIITLWSGMRHPSNDIRFITGILFGNSLCLILYPSFNALMLTNKNYERGIESFGTYAILLGLCVVGFLISKANHLVSLYILNSLSILGFSAVIISFSIFLLKELQVGITFFKRLHK